MSVSLALSSPAVLMPPMVNPRTGGPRVRDQQRDRPFACPVPQCGGRFHRKFTLHEHMKTHTGEQPHQCPIKSCGKRFSTSGNLARHKRLHALHKMECPVAGCTRIFTNKDMLAKHQKVHNGAAVHTCQVAGCGKTFSTAGNLTRHMKTQHRVVNPRSGASVSAAQLQLPRRATPTLPALSALQHSHSVKHASADSPCDQIPVVDYDCMTFLPPPTEAGSHTNPFFFSASAVAAATAAATATSAAQASTPPHSQTQTQTAVPTHPISDQDLKDFLECLF